MHSYFGHCRSQLDCLILFEAACLGVIPRVSQRLSEDERVQITSGAIYIWDEEEAGIKRWTDGKSWSTSRVSGPFLTYRELETVPVSETSSGCQIKPYGLCKQSASITVGANTKLHLIAYYNKEDVRVGNLMQPSMDLRFKEITALAKKDNTGLGPGVSMGPGLGPTPSPGTVAGSGTPVPMAMAMPHPVGLPMAVPVLSNVALTPPPVSPRVSVSDHMKPGRSAQGHLPGQAPTIHASMLANGSTPPNFSGYPPMPPSPPHNAASPAWTAPSPPLDHAYGFASPHSGGQPVAMLASHPSTPVQMNLQNAYTPAQSRPSGSKTPVAALSPLMCPAPVSASASARTVNGLGLNNVLAEPAGSEMTMQHQHQQVARHADCRLPALSRKDAVQRTIPSMSPSPLPSHGVSGSDVQRLPSIHRAPAPSSGPVRLNTGHSMPSMAMPSRHAVTGPAVPFSRAFEEDRRQLSLLDKSLSAY